MNSILFTLLASKPWIYSTFSAIRKTAIGASGTVAGTALIIGSLIVTFKLIKLAYDLMSDEQSSGFGQIDVKTVLRPFLILMLLQSFPTVLGWFDGVVDGVATSLVGSLSYQESNVDLGKLCDAVDEQNENMSDADKAIANYVDANWWQRLSGKRKKEATNAILEDYMNSELAEFSAGERISLNSEQGRTWEKSLGEEKKEQLLESAHTALRVYCKASRRLSKGASYVSVAVSWLFEQLYYIVDAFAEVFLCVIALLGPFAILCSLFDFMRDAWKKFFAKYAQVSLWKVAAAAVMFTIASARTSTFSHAKNAMAQALDTIRAGSMVDVSGASSGIILNIIICVAGMICLTNVPAMAAAVIEAASGGSAMGGAEGLAAGAVSRVKGAPGAMAGGLKGGVQQAHGNGTAKALKSLDQNLTAIGAKLAKK